MVNARAKHFCVHDGTNFEDKKHVGGDVKYQEKQGGETSSYEEVQKKGAAKGRRKKRVARS